ncbi:MAG: outer membrane lipoprotein-sorting protein [Gammaproteobacteria bacterium]|nr:outer membrane lipoprotein-sorting protein [Gammaproteobacteria bacterium]
MFRWLGLSTVLVLCGMNVQAQDVDDILKQADSYRQTAESIRVDLDIDTYENEQFDKKRQYRVYIKPGRRSLVVFKTPDQIGQKILLNGDNFYLFMPQSRRAIRITPMQKLLGEASTGDIANMTWSEDYTGTLASAAVDVEGRQCILLELAASRKGVTYERIELYVDQKGYAPVFAKLYLKSGKLAKEAYYYLDKLNGRMQVTRMKLVDKIKDNRYTLVNYHAMSEMAFSDNYFNSQYLARTTIE